jgi:isoleucyl-tRNA synthetase
VRFKSSDEEDKQYALATTAYTLREFSKIIAPFMPFIAEYMYRGTNGERESVHLEEWPKVELRIKKKELRILEEMEEVRRIVSLALEARMRAGIKVRQPLAELRIKNKELGIKDNRQLVQLIKDEVNVKEVLFDERIENEVELDTEVSEELKKEGDKREFIRSLQDLRKEAGFRPSEAAVLDASGDTAAIGLVKEFEEDIKRAVSLSEIRYQSGVEGREVSVRGGTLRAKLRKG